MPNKHKSEERVAFEDAMKTILRADPQAVRDAVEAEIQANTARREAKGEHKRGRKPRSKKGDN